MQQGSQDQAIFLWNNPVKGMSAIFEQSTAPPLQFYILSSELK